MVGSHGKEGLFKEEDVDFFTRVCLEGLGKTRNVSGWYAGLDDGFQNEDWRRQNGKGKEEEMMDSVQWSIQGYKRTRGWI